MTQPVPFCPVPIPVPNPSTDWPGNLRDVIDTQQQTIKFLLQQWDQLVSQVAIAGGQFGPIVNFNPNDFIPSGWWQVVIPNTSGTEVAEITLNGDLVKIYVGVFWSDGNVKVTCVTAIALVRVAVLTPPC